MVKDTTFEKISNQLSEGINNFLKNIIKDNYISFSQLKEHFQNYKNYMEGLLYMTKVEEKEGKDKTKTIGVCEGKIHLLDDLLGYVNDQFTTKTDLSFIRSQGNRYKKQKEKRLKEEKKKREEERSARIKAMKDPF